MRGGRRRWWLFGLGIRLDWTSRLIVRFFSFFLSLSPPPLVVLNLIIYNPRPEITDYERSGEAVVCAPSRFRIYDTRQRLGTETFCKDDYSRRRFSAQSETPTLQPPLRARIRRHHARKRRSRPGRRSPRCPCFPTVTAHPNPGSRERKHGRGPDKREEKETQRKETRKNRKETG